MTDKPSTGKGQDTLKRKQGDDPLTQSTTKHILNTYNLTGTSNRIESSTMSSADQQTIKVRDLSRKIFKGLSISEQKKNDQPQTIENTMTKRQKTNIKETLTREYPFLPEKQISKIEDIQRQITETHAAKNFSYHDLYTSIQNGIKAISKMQETIPNLNKIKDTLKKKEDESTEANQSLDKLYQQYNQLELTTPSGQATFSSELGIEESFDDPFSQNLEAELLHKRIDTKIQDIDIINQQISLYEQQISLYEQQTDNITQTQQKLKETLQTYEYWANDLRNRHLDTNIPYSGSETKNLKTNNTQTEVPAPIGIESADHKEKKKATEQELVRQQIEKDKELTEPMQCSDDEETALYLQQQEIHNVHQIPRIELSTSLPNENWNEPFQASTSRNTGEIIQYPPHKLSNTNSMEFTEIEFSNKSPKTSSSDEDDLRGRSPKSKKSTNNDKIRITSPNGTTRDAYELGGPKKFANTYGTYENYNENTPIEQLKKRTGKGNTIRGSAISSISNGKTFRAGNWHAEVGTDNKRRITSPNGTTRDVRSLGGPRKFADTYGTYENYNENTPIEQLKKRTGKGNTINESAISELTTERRDKAGNWHAEVDTDNKNKRRITSPNGTTRDVYDLGGPKKFAATHGTYENYNKNTPIEQLKKRTGKGNTINEDCIVKLTNGRRDKSGNWHTKK